MAKYIMKRIVYVLITLFIVTSITFMLIRIIPGSPIEKMAEKLPEKQRQLLYEKYGFDKPLSTQYKIFWRKFLKEGDLGQSLKYKGRKVKDIIKNYSPVSFKLGFQAMLIGVSIGVTLGIVAALNRGKWPDYLVTILAMLGVSIPHFVVASFLQYYITIKNQWLPTTGWGSFKYTILPSLTLSLGSIAQYARYMRANTLDVLNKDYIITAKAKGLSREKIIKKHILRNAILPIITLLGPHIAMLFGGAFVVENMFSIPGLGSYFVSSVSDRDYTMIMGQTMFITFLYIFSILIVDILYGIIDPRIRIGQKKGGSR